MKAVSRIGFAVLGFILAIIYSAPTLALVFSLALVAYAKYISMFFCFVFAWNISMMVKSIYGSNENNR